MFLTAEQIWLILLNENGVVILLMADFVAIFYGLDGAFKPYVDKLRPILDLLAWKTTESMGYDVTR